MKVAVIGASDKPHRYSYKAVMLLKENGHDVYPVHQRVKNVGGIPVYPSVKDIREEMDTVTLYVNAEVSTKMGKEIIAGKPGRIIFNPGAENSELEKNAIKAGISTMNACTLVMLNTGQF